MKVKLTVEQLKELKKSGFLKFEKLIIIYDKTTKDVHIAELIGSANLIGV